MSNFYQVLLNNDLANALTRFALNYKRKFFVGLICVLIVYVFASLLSYNPADPAWSHYSNHTTTTTNIGGVGGAYLSDWLYTFFGFGAWLVLLWLSLEAKNAYYHKKYFVLPLRLMAYGLLWACVAVLLYGFGQSIAVGGVVGHEIYVALSAKAGHWASLAMVAVLFLVAAALLVMGLREVEQPIASQTTSQNRYSDTEFVPPVMSRENSIPQYIRTSEGSLLGNFLQNSGLKDELLAKKEQNQPTDNTAADTQTTNVQTAGVQLANHLPSNNPPNHQPHNNSATGEHLEPFGNAKTTGDIQATGDELQGTTIQTAHIHHATINANTIHQTIIYETGQSGETASTNSPQQTVPQKEPFADLDFSSIAQLKTHQTPATMDTPVADTIAAPSPPASEPPPQEPAIKKQESQDLNIQEPTVQEPTVQESTSPPNPLPKQEQAATESEVVLEYVAKRPLLFGLADEENIQAVSEKTEEIIAQTATETDTTSSDAVQVATDKDGEALQKETAPSIEAGLDLPKSAIEIKATDDIESNTAELNTAELDTTEPNNGEFGKSNSDDVKPNTLEPAPLEPTNTNLQMAEVVETEAVETKIAEAKAVEVGATDTEMVETKTAEPEVAEAGATELQIVAKPDINDDSAFIGKSLAMQTAAYRASLPPLPSLDLLDPKPMQEFGYSQEELVRLSELLEIKLREFGVKASVAGVVQGPIVTSFEVELAAGVKASRVTGISKDLARSLSMASLRVVEVIPGKPYIGIEIPNQTKEIVKLIELLQTDDYQSGNSQIAMAMGKDIGSNVIITDLAKAPHMLVAGTTGSGKSVLVNAMLLSMLLKYTPNQLRMILIDPKMTELSPYDDIPHLLTPVVTDMTEAAAALSWCVGEMERRGNLMKLLRVRNIFEFNEKVKAAEEAGESLLDPLWRPEDSALQNKPPKLKPLPLIVVVADEFADMMMQIGKQVEELIARLAQKSRASGIHLILATQRPSADVVTGLIKANIPSRVGLRVNDKINSRTILDASGAEDMLGNGDMLFLAPGKNEPIRVHGAYVTTAEVNRITDAWRERGAPDYIDTVTSVSNLPDDGAGRGGDDGVDALYDEALTFVLETKKTSTSAVQRHLKIGYNRAANIVESLERQGVLSAPDHSGKRTLLA